MTKTLMSAASAIAILLGSSAVYAQATTGTAGDAGATGQQQLGAGTGEQQLGQAGMGMGQELRGTIESKDEDNREIVLRLATGEQVDFDDFEEGDEVYVSFGEDHQVGRIGREPGEGGLGTQQ
jgi:hypothetical protein